MVQMRWWCCAALCFFPPVAHAQEKRPLPPLILQARLLRNQFFIDPAAQDPTSKAKFQPGNNLVLVLKVWNPSNQTLDILGPPEPELRLSGPRKESVQKVGGHHFFVAQTQQWRLKPQESFQVVLHRLHFRQDTSQFQLAWLEPGDYRLEIVWPLAVVPPPDPALVPQKKVFQKVDLQGSPMRFTVRPGNTLAFWTQALEDQEEKVRQAAVAILKDRGPAASSAAPALARRLNKESTATMVGILAALEALGKSGQDVALAIQEVLTDADPVIRAAAARALARVAPAVKTTGPVLAALLPDSIADVRRAAAEAFHYMGHHGWRPTPKETTALITALERDPDSPTRYHLVHALMHAREERVVAALLPLLKDGEPPVKAAALYSLGQMAYWLPPEVKARKDGAVGQLLEQLIALLLAKEKLDKSECEHVVYILANLREYAAPAVPALRVALKYPHFQGKDSLYHPRTRIIMALRDIGPPALAAAPDLADRLLKDTDWSTRAFAAEALGALGPQAPREARAALVQALDQKMSQVSNAAVQALAKVEAVPELLVALRHPEVAVRSLAAHVLFPLGPKSAPAFPVLAEMAVADQDVLARRSAASVLGSLKAVAALPQLVQALDDPDDQVRRHAARSLGQFTAQGKPALDPLLARIPKEKNGENRQALVVALSNIGVQGHKDAAAVLLPLLEDSQPGTPLTVVYLLGQLGPQARAAVPALRRVAARDSGVLGQQAAEVLRKIEMK